MTEDRQAAQRPIPGESSASRILAGKRVIELSYGFAAPVATRYLAAFGADVIRVESGRHPENVRLIAPAWLPDDLPPEVRFDTRPLLQATSANKRSAVIELDAAGGREAFDRLLASADFFVTNLAPPALDKLGLTDSAVLAANDRIVYIAISTFGDAGAGPYRAYRTWGNNLAAFAGLFAGTGFADDGPLLWPVNYSDFIGAFAAVSAALATVARARVGPVTEPQRTIKLALHEILAAAMGDDFEAALNGESSLEQQGNDDLRYRSQGVYPTSDPERWLALTLRTDEDIRKIQSAWPELAGLCATPRSALSARLEHAIERLSAAEVVSILGPVDIPWELVQSVEDLLDDSALRRDDFWQLRPHRRLRRDLVEALPLIADGQRVADSRGFPALGEHTMEILLELGFSPEEVAGLDRSGEVRLLAHPEFEIGPRPWLRQSPPPLGLSELGEA